jgi:hypothetical protein
MKPKLFIAKSSSQTMDAIFGHGNPSSHFLQQNEMKLRLMHHWTIKPCHKFSQLLSETFRIYVVQQALQHEHLMDAMFALASLHMAAEFPATNDERATCLTDALQYQSSAVPVFRAALENISPTNCEALFACSVIIMACIVVFPTLENDSQRNINHEKKLSTDLSSLFQFVKGIHSIIGQARPSLEAGPFHLVIVPYVGEDQMSSLINEGVLPPALKELCHSAPLALREVYEHAVEMLERCAMAEGMVIPWIVIAGEEFVGQVENAEPVALSIYVCWAALFGCLGECGGPV